MTNTKKSRSVTAAYTIAATAVAWAAVMTFAAVGNDAPATTTPEVATVSVTAPIADCEAQYAAWSRDAAVLIEDVVALYDAGVEYNAQTVNGDNVLPMLDRLTYIQSICTEGN